MEVKPSSPSPFSALEQEVLGSSASYSSTSSTSSDSQASGFSWDSSISTLTDDEIHNEISDFFRNSVSLPQVWVRRDRPYMYMYT